MATARSAKGGAVVAKEDDLEAAESLLMNKGKSKNKSALVMPRPAPSRSLLFLASVSGLAVTAALLRRYVLTSSLSAAGGKPPPPHEQSAAADADDGVISNEAMAATVLAVLGSLVGVYFYFFRGVNNTPEAIEVRQKKARLALAQMAQTIIMAKERKEQDARVAANGGVLPEGEERKPPPDAVMLFETIFDTIEERHLTELGVEAMGEGGEGSEYQAVRELFRERFPAQLRELLKKTRRADGGSFESEEEANDLAKYRDGSELRELVQLSEKDIALNFSKPLVTDLRTYPAVVTPEVKELIKQCRRYSDENGPGRDHPSGKYGAIWEVMRPQVPMYAAGMMLFLVESSVGPVMWAKMFTVFDKLQDHTMDIGQFRWLLISFLFKWTFFVLLHVVGLSLMNKANSQFALRIRTAIMSAMMRQDVEFFDRTPSGVLQERMNKDATDLSQNMLEEPKQFLRCVAIIVSQFVVLFEISPTLLFWAILPVPVVAFVQYQGVKSRKKTNRRMRNMSDQAAADTAEIIKEIRTVREFAKEPNEAGKFKAASSYRATIEELATAIMHIGFGWPLFLVFMANRCQAMYNIANGVYDAQFSVGVAIQFVIGVSMVCDHLRMIMDIVPKLMKIETPMKRVNELLLAKGRIEPQVGDAEKLTTVGGVLEFRSVDFSVPDKKILRNMSFKIEPGTTVGICGSAGAGKTTVMNLIKQFYRPTGGEILLGGRPAHEYDLTAYRRHISVVGQENVLFSTTIRENVIYGLTEAEKKAPDIDARIEQACRDASIWDDIMTLFPRKLESYVGEKGFKLSGGQKQRLAIARAMIRKSSFLMLDEPTAALDSVNEKVVQQALENMRQQNKSGCTLMIAHRLTTIKNCDKIMVFKHGTKVEEGPHSTLLEIEIKKKKTKNPVAGKPDVEETTSGHYRELWETQNGKQGAQESTMEPWVRHLEARVKKLEAELREARKDELASYSPKKITDRRTRLKYLLRQQQDMDHENDPSYGNADNAPDNHHMLMSLHQLSISEDGLGACPKMAMAPKLAERAASTSY